MTGDTLRELRLRRGWSQGVLSRVSGVAVGTISAHERRQHQRMQDRTHDRLTFAFACYPTIEDFIRQDSLLEAQNPATPQGERPTPPPQGD